MRGYAGEGEYIFIYKIEIVLDLVDVEEKYYLLWMKHISNDE